MMMKQILKLILKQVQDDIFRMTSSESVASHSLSTVCVLLPGDYTGDTRQQRFYVVLWLIGLLFRAGADYL